LQQSNSQKMTKHSMLSRSFNLLSSKSSE